MRQRMDKYELYRRTTGRSKIASSLQFSESFIDILLLLQIASTMAKYVDADPYKWPFNGDLTPSNTCIIVIGRSTMGGGGVL
jgi:hypothetical protein